MTSGELVAYCKELRGEHVFFQPNPGNAGDALIAAATLDLFRRLGIDFTVLGRSVPDLRNQIVIFGGGGSFYWRGGLEFIQRHAPVARRFVIFPQTVVGNEEFLKSMGPNVHLFCREIMSYDYCRGLDLKGRVLLDHDMAFSLPVREWMDRLGHLRLFLQSPSRWCKGVRHFREGCRKIPGSRTLQAFRGDKESRRPDTVSLGPNYDVSGAFGLDHRKEGFINASAWFFLKYIDRYEHVVTDRLHVSIAAAILGKRVSLYPNVYFKNRAVYEYSLSGRFPNVEWMEWPKP